MLHLRQVNGATGKFPQTPLYWPTLPGFPLLIEGSPWLSWLIQVALAAIGVAVQILLRKRPERGGATMVGYALTVAMALAAIFEMLDMLTGAVLHA